MEKSSWINPLAVTHDVELIHELGEEDFEVEFHNSFLHCKKNPGHHEFIPMNEFSLEHLPVVCRNNDMLQYVRGIGERTMKLKVSCTSSSRPDTFPDTYNGSELPYYQPGGCYPWKNKAGTKCTRLGSGFVTFVTIIGVPPFGNKSKALCPCSKDCQEKKWARIEAITARHLVYNQEEADNLEVEFFFNTDQDRTEGKTRIIQGVQVSDTSLEGDRCGLVLYTHDMSSIERLKKAGQSIHKQMPDLKQKEDQIIHPVFVVGHPHGGGKVVTVGEVTEHRMDTDSEEMFDPVLTFNAPTCPGSSGGPVIWFRYDDEMMKTLLVSLPRPHSGSLKTCSADGKKLGRCGQLFL